MLEIKRILPEQRELLPKEYAMKPAFLAREDDEPVGYCVFDVEPDRVTMLDIWAKDGDREVFELEIRAAAANFVDDFKLFVFGCGDAERAIVGGIFGITEREVATERLLRGNCCDRG